MGPEAYHCIDGGLCSVILSGPVVSFVISFVPLVMNQLSAGQGSRRGVDSDLPVQQHAVAEIGPLVAQHLLDAEQLVVFGRAVRAGQ